MSEPRKITDAAIDCAIHNAPEPQNGWRNHLPPEDLGAMVDAGSGQITLQALVAALQYGPRPYAVRTLTNYVRLSPQRIGLSEPWSLIYFKAIVCNWLAVIIIATRIGEHDLARAFRDLLSRWAGTCALMAVNGVILAAGCRCWGHEVHGGGWDDLWAFATGKKQPPAPGSHAYGTVGADDDWGWLNRCARMALAELRAAAAPFAGREWHSLLPAIPRWGARTEMQLIGYADGSRLWIMGDDEPGFDDEDQNGNTPGWLLAGVLGGKPVTLPRWPNPADGSTRLRQTGCRADIDGTPETGWTLWHSRLGERLEAGGFISRVEPHTSAVVFWQLCPAGSLVWVDKLAGADLPPMPAPVPDPTSPGPGKPPKPATPKPCRRHRWQFWRPECPK